MTKFDLEIENMILKGELANRIEELNEKDALIDDLFDSLSDRDSSLEDADIGCELAAIKIDKLTDCVQRLLSLIESETEGFSYPYEHKVSIIEYAKNLLV
jgi:hypothetical protein